MIRRSVGGCGCAGLLLLGLLFSLPVFGASATDTTATTAANLVPAGRLNQPVRILWRPLFVWTPATGEANASEWPTGQCTWFVVSEGRLGGDHRVSWSGDAWMWIAAAEAAHAETELPGTIPEVGWIAVYSRGHGSNLSAGHVAVVVSVAGDDYTVAEANVIGLGVVDLRTLGLPGSPDAADGPQLEGWIP